MAAELNRAMAGTDEVPDSVLDAQVEYDSDDEEDDTGSRVSEKDLKVALRPQSTGPLISLEDANVKIGEKVLQVLDEKFKGQLTEVRHLDDGDLLD